MFDDVTDIAAYYNNDPEREHNRLQRHQLEHDLTWRYFDQYLPSQGTILEIGTATGRYTLELAKRGYTITAVDLSAVLLEECRKKITDNGLNKQVRFITADARCLNEVVEKEFDVVLLMGPLYHLTAEPDRKAALKESFDRLQQGGLIFSSLISRFGIMGDLLRNMPSWIEDQAEVRSILEQGKDPAHLPHEGFRGYFATFSEVTPLHESVGFETLEVVGVEPAISADDESYNNLQGEQRQLWLDLLYEISKEKSIVGASRHLLYIGRKK